MHLVSPYRRQIYSGKLPGWAANHYLIESCAIALDMLAARARFGFHETAGVGVKPQATRSHAPMAIVFTSLCCPSTPARCHHRWC